MDIHGVVKTPIGEDAKKQRIEELVAGLKLASEDYYSDRQESMSNYEWDAKFDELALLEAETGYILPDSPTQNVGAADEENNNNGAKEQHEIPPLSLAKTKDVQVLQKWAEDKAVWLSWKLDGLTLVLTYDDGKLTKILTRGNGTIGTNITFMKGAIKGFPLKTEERGHLVVRGEATISYTDFDMLNDTIENDDEKYANPRNLASGTLGLDISNLEKVRERRISFSAFTLVYAERSIESWGERMDWLDDLGFNTIEREKTDADGLPEVVDRWTKKVEAGEMDIPVDGLVICYDDTEYAATGSITGHHATRAGYAFKWQDVSAFTQLDYVEWSCAASTITPIAVFDTVQLEGTSVSRASLCNISEMERLGIGENRRTTLEIIKANKIIPKCISVKEVSGKFSVPEECPVCGTKTEIRISERSTVKTLHCTNPSCPAKHVKRFARFVSKQGMDIDGLSIKTLLKFMNLGYIYDFADIYGLEVHAEEIKAMEGFGEKSCDNLLNAIEKSRNVHPVNLIFALCIPMIGIDAGKKIIGKLGGGGFIERLNNGQEFEDVDGIGPERSNAITGWYAAEDNKKTVAWLLEELDIEKVEPEEESGGACSKLIFVITGEVRRFANRDAFKAYVEGEGGSVTGSVSKKTNFLVNNDVLSESNKNQKAKSMDIPIISEDEFIERFGGG